MKGYTREQVIEHLHNLEKQLNGNLLHDMELQDQILEVKRELGIAPDACNLDGGDCDSCGS